MCHRVVKCSLERWFSDCPDLCGKFTTEKPEQRGAFNKMKCKWTAFIELVWPWLVDRKFPSLPYRPAPECWNTSNCRCLRTICREDQQVSAQKAFPQEEQLNLALVGQPGRSSQAMHAERYPMFYGWRGVRGLYTFKRNKISKNPLSV